MRRTSAAVIGTLSGTALLLGAKFGISQHDAAGADQAANAPGDPGAAGQSAAPAPSSAPSTKPSGSSKGGGGLKAGTYTGVGSTNKYGTERVTITVASGRLAMVTSTYPTTPSTSDKINSRAIPKLRQEALTAQSAHVNTVSGATYTSSSFRTSLQSALGMAGA